MAIHIQIKYPELSDVVTEQDLIILKRFEGILRDSMLTVMCSTSNYRWEYDPRYQSDRFYSLVNTCESKVVGTFGIRALTSLPPQDMIDKIRIDQLFPPKQ
jgi:hypothetical protein